MLSTINLQYQRSFQAYKIDNVITDGVLPTKLISSKLFQPQISPEQFLGIGHFAAQTAGILLCGCFKSRQSTHNFPPAPQ